MRRLVLVNEGRPSDVLAMSAAIESLHRTYPGRFVTAVAGTAIELFAHDPNVVAIEEMIDGTCVAWERIQMPGALADRCDEGPGRTMSGYCEFLTRELGVPVPLAVNRPLVSLSPEERAGLPEVHEISGERPRYWLVDAGSEDIEPERWWGAANFQRVVDLLRGQALVVQIGGADRAHEPLSGALDLRGRTGLRRLARLVYHSAGGIGPSALLKHLCAAFEKPFVCVAGAKRAPRGGSPTVDEPKALPGDRPLGAGDPGSGDLEPIRPEQVVAALFARG